MMMIERMINKKIMISNINVKKKKDIIIIDYNDDCDDNDYNKDRYLNDDL